MATICHKFGENEKVFNKYFVQNRLRIDFDYYNNY